MKKLLVLLAAFVLLGGCVDSLFESDSNKFLRYLNMSQNADYKVTYDATESIGSLTKNATYVVYSKDGETRIDSKRPNITGSSIYYLKKGNYSCSLGTYMYCMKIESLGSLGLYYDISYAMTSSRYSQIKDNPDNYGITSLEPKKIMGDDTACFKVITKNYSVSKYYSLNNLTEIVCFSQDGIPYYRQSGLYQISDSTDIEIIMTATKRDIPKDSDFIVTETSSGNIKYNDST